MSHTVKSQVQFKNIKTLEKVCKKVGAKFRKLKSGERVQLYGDSVTGDYAIELPGWRFPIVVQGDEAKYDNYNGHWGKQETFDNLKQNYAIDIAKEKAQAFGPVGQKVLEDGSVQLEVTW